jgi:hypothetical protein
MPQLQLLLQHIYIKMQTVSSLFGGKCADLLKQDERIYQSETDLFSYNQLGACV